MKKISWLLLCCVLATGLCLTAVACGDSSTDKPTYLVEVEGGTGGGNYYGDVNCTVVAEIPDGKQFLKWVSGDKEMSANATYTFTVKENVKLTAVFAEDVGIGELYTINVRFGSGTGTYFAGTEHLLKVSGEYEGLNFTGWQAKYTDADGQEKTEIISTENPFTLTVSKDMEITACFAETKLETPDNSEGQFFRIAENGAYEMDRQKDGQGNKKTAFTDGCAYLVYRMYDSDGPDANPVTSFKIVPLAQQVGEYYHTQLTSMDGTKTYYLLGPFGDLYLDQATDQAEIRSLLGIETGKTYYFDVQAIAKEGTLWTDSDVSVIGPGCTF